MILKSKVICLQATHVPPSEYIKDGKTRTKTEFWECLLRYEDNVYSRAKKTTVRCMVEDMHDSKVELKAGNEYDIVLEAGVMFGELKLTVAEATQINKPVK